MIDAKLLNLCEDVASLKAGQEAAAEKLDRLIYYLQGNGRPGVIAEILTKAEILSTRVDKVDLRLTRWAGIGFGAWGLASVTWVLFQVIHGWTH